MQVDPTYARRRETASELVQGGRAWLASAPCLQIFGRRSWRWLDWPIDRSCLKLDWTGRARLAGA
jgi:hypothetical protein